MQRRRRRKQGDGADRESEVGTTRLRSKGAGAGVLGRAQRRRRALSSLPSALRALRESSEDGLRREALHCGLFSVQTSSRLLNLHLSSLYSYTSPSQHQQSSPVQLRSSLLLMPHHETAGAARLALFTELRPAPTRRSGRRKLPATHNNMLHDSLLFLLLPWTGRCLGDATQ